MADVPFSCPFCGAKAIVHAGDGDVVHETPTCAPFDEAADSLAFMEAVNNEIARQRGPAAEVLLQTMRSDEDSGRQEGGPS